MKEGSKDYEGRKEGRKEERLWGKEGRLEGRKN